MIIEHKENVSSNFEGTIIDIETIGEFNRRYRATNDSREYEYIQQIIFGFINGQGLHIFYVREMEGITELNEKVVEIIDSLERPFYAFSSEFERGVFFHQLGKKINFEGELQKEKYESKADAVRNLGIPNYDDPFYDRGLWCMNAWHNGEFDAAIAHNRACLLKEREILLKRGFREPDELKFVKPK